MIRFCPLCQHQDGDAVVFGHNCSHSVHLQCALLNTAILSQPCSVCRAMSVVNIDTAATFASFSAVPNPAPPSPIPCDRTPPRHVVCLCCPRVQLDNHTGEFIHMLDRRMPWSPLIDPTGVLTRQRWICYGCGREAHLDEFPQLVTRQRMWCQAHHRECGFAISFRDGNVHIDNVCLTNPFQQEEMPNILHEVVLPDLTAVVEIEDSPILARPVPGSLVPLGQYHDGIRCVLQPHSQEGMLESLGSTMPDGPGMSPYFDTMPDGPGMSPYFDTTRYRHRSRFSAVVADASSVLDAAADEDMPIPIDEECPPSQESADEVAAAFAAAFDGDEDSDDD